MVKEIEFSDIGTSNANISGLSLSIAVDTSSALPTNLSQLSLDDL